MKKNTFPQEEIIAKEFKCTENFLKVFSKTNQPISIKLNTNHSCLNVFHVCSDEGEHPSPRENDGKRIKIH
jgi:hypothetical protein